MNFIILILSLGSLISGIAIVMEAKTSIHEIESLILFTMFAILISAYGIINKIDNLEVSLKLKVNNVDHDEKKKSN